MIEEITSLKDDKIQLAKSLGSVKERRVKHKFLIEGSEAIEWAVSAGITIDFVLMAKSIKVPDTRLSLLDSYRVSDGLLKKVTDTKYLIPVVAVGNRKPSIPLPDFLVVLDNIKDFGNIGTIVRTCHAFGIRTVLSSSSESDIFQAKTIDASRGKVFSTDYRPFPSPSETIAFLRKHDFRLVTTSPYGSEIQSLVSLKDHPLALVVGNETEGVSKEFFEQSDVIIQIPMYHGMESLNVGVAAGISIYELKLKQVLGMIEKKIKSTLGREINVTAMLIQEVLDLELKKVSDLSSKQLVFMMVLKCDGTMRLLDAQKQFGIPDLETKSFFNPLMSKGFIQHNSSGDLLINESGIETIGKLWTIIDNAEEMILGEFTDTERQELKRLIGKLMTQCVDIINRNK